MSNLTAAIQVIETLNYKELNELRYIVRKRTDALVYQEMVTGGLPWASDEELSLCQNGEEVKAYRAYRARAKCDLIIAFNAIRITQEVERNK